jgi:N-acetylglucosaminyldiphosphoundecaprenol N-acetyl-beta-D-mannosaminyltransferase
MTGATHLNPRVDVLGVGISPLTMDAAVGEVERWIDEGLHHYVCVTGVHGVIESQRDPQLRDIHNASGLTTPDGMPMVWAAHYAGARHVERVYGPDLMLRLLQRAAQRGWPSFLYGGKEGVPELLAQRLKERIPGLPIAGTYSPPFRELTPEEDEEIVVRINASGARLVWVGLSTPKQERWMGDKVGRLHANALLGVGAAFDFHAGLVRQAPPWIRRRGLEWAYRLAQEPGRLWRRYLRSNSSFLVRILRRPPRLMSPNGEAGEAGAGDRR